MRGVSSTLRPSDRDGRQAKTESESGGLCGDMRFGSLGEPRETGKVVVADHFAEPMTLPTMGGQRVTQ